MVKGVVAFLPLPPTGLFIFREYFESALPVESFFVGQPRIVGLCRDNGV